MSIASEITRLQGVKSDILTAIGNKGVSVPADSALDDCPGLIGNIKEAGKGFRNGVDNHLWFLTDNFDLDSPSIIEENIVSKCNQWQSAETFQICGGQWGDGSSSYYGIAIYIRPDKIQFNDKNGTIVYENNIPYTFSDVVKKNIVYNKITEEITCKIYYNNILVCTKLFPISSARFGSSVHYVIGGNRMHNTTSFSGEIDFSKSFIKFDNVIIW